MRLSLSVLALAFATSTFGYAIPPGFTELDVNDAISAAIPAVYIPSEPTSTLVVNREQRKDRKLKAKRDYTEVAGSTIMKGAMKRGIAAGPVMKGGTRTLTTGEGQGFWYSCTGDEC